MNKIEEILKTMEYGPALEPDSMAHEWLASRNNWIGHFINGEFTRKSRSSFESNSPIDGKKIADVALGKKADVDAAVNAARMALASWSRIKGCERAGHLDRLARLTQKYARLLAVIETIDNGKPIREARDIDIPLAVRHFYYHAGWAKLLECEFSGMRAAGVCGQIIPWNFPLLMLAWKVAPALAAGCTIVLKPAQDTPLSASIFAQLCNEAGLPPGVFNIVNGEDETGEIIVRHEGIDKIAFTGSTEVGRLVRRATAGSGKKISLELGGKSPFIVFDSADIDAAIEGVVDSIWSNQGEICCAGSRALIQAGIANGFYAKLKERMERIRLGNPLDENTDMGAIVNQSQLTNIEARVAQGVASGARLWQPQWTRQNEIDIRNENPGGHYYPPTLLTNVQPASLLAQEEIFGPVLATMTFRTPDEGIALANNSRFGLAASIWSQNLDIALDAARKVQAGVVWINAANMSDPAIGFGGYRESGFGREGGREGMMEYLTPAWQKKDIMLPDTKKVSGTFPVNEAGKRSHDCTIKFYIGGKWTRPDSDCSHPVYDTKGELTFRDRPGNSEDIHNAVKAARKADAWSEMTGYQRAQILYSLAMNLEERRDALINQLVRVVNVSSRKADAEFDASINRVLHYAACADKYYGATREPLSSTLVLSLKESWQVMGISCPDEAPLLSFLSLTLPALAMGNRTVVTPSQMHPQIALDVCQAFNTIRIPEGTINVVVGTRNELASVMAKHDDIAAHWYFGCREGSKMVERESAGNLKATWVSNGRARDWFDPEQGAGKEFLFRSVQFKNVWIPFGV